MALEGLGLAAGTKATRRLTALAFLGLEWLDSDLYGYTGGFLELRDAGGQRLVVRCEDPTRLMRDIEQARAQESARVRVATA